MSFAGHSHLAFIAALGVFIALVFVAIAGWTKASRRETLAALFGGLVAGAVNVATDSAAYALGYWHYTEVTTPFAPILYYLEAGVGCGALGLVMHRLHRRYGPRGPLAMLGVLAVYAPIRDGATAELTGLMEFHYDPWPIVVLADALSSFVIPVAVAYAAVRLVKPAS